MEEEEEGGGGGVKVCDSPAPTSFHRRENDATYHEESEQEGGVGRIYLATVPAVIMVLTVVVVLTI